MKKLLISYPWLTFLLPFVVFMLVGSLEPTPEKVGASAIGLAIPYSAYPIVYTLKIAATFIAMALVLRGYKAFPPKISFWGFAVGIVGIAVWVAICSLDLEHRYLKSLFDQIGLGSFIGAGDRAAFNPFEHFDGKPALAWSFLAVRFVGLALVVPIIEEFFLRGFVIRIVVDPRWEDVPFGKLTVAAAVVGTVFPMLMHPGELLAAAVWFSMVTWLMAKTKNIWDCVVAHAVTNLLLGVYVLASGAWRLW